MARTSLMNPVHICIFFSYFCQMWHAVVLPFTPTCVSFVYVLQLNFCVHLSFSFILHSSPILTSFIWALWWYLVEPTKHIVFEKDKKVRKIFPKFRCKSLLPFLYLTCGLVWCVCTSDVYLYYSITLHLIVLFGCVIVERIFVACNSFLLSNEEKGWLRSVNWKGLSKRTWPI